jgi:hypothetical protein
MLATFALVSLQELKDHLGSGGAAKDSVLETVINRVSDEIEDYLERQIVTRGTLTEFHTFTAAGVAFYSADLRTLEYPIASVTTVHEDTGVPRTYGAGALLVADTDYQVVKPSGVIRRISGLGQPMNWATGLRAVKVTYAAGYATTAAVPDRIKAVALRYAALIWDEQKRGAFGVSGASDALGNYTRFSAASLSPDLQAALTRERRMSLWESGERDA